MEELIFLATTYNPECRLHLDKHIDGYYTLQYMQFGGVELSYDDESVRMVGEWFWPAYPGPRLRFCPAPGFDYWFHRHVGFRGPRVQQWIADGLWPWKAQVAPPGREYAARFDEMITLVRRDDRFGRLRALNLLEQILLELAEARSSGSFADVWLKEVISGIEADGTFVPDYRLLAARLNIGESTLRRRFKQMTGITVHEYVLTARLTRARHLLTETDLSLSEIALRLGYDSVYFFGRQFKQRFGVPPGMFRRSRQK